MKKTFTLSFLIAVCCAFFAGCSKDIKAPSKAAPAATAAYTSTQTTGGNQENHTCGNDGNSSYTYNGNGY